MRIGELAKKYGYDARSIDYFTTLGLLKEAGRSSGNYRDYGKDAEEAMLFIAIGQALELKGISFEDSTAFVKALPKPLWETMIIEKLEERKRDAMKRYDMLISLAKDYSKG